MLSSNRSRLGLVVVAVVVPWQKKVCSSKALFLSFPVHPPSHSVFNPRASFNTVRTACRSSTTTPKGGHSCPPSSSFSFSSASSFPSNCTCWCVSLGEPQESKPCRGRVPGKSFLELKSIFRVSTSLQAGGSPDHGPSVLSSYPPCRSSVTLSRWSGGQHRQRDDRKNCRRGQQMKKRLSVEAIASIDDQATDSNEKPLLSEELHRHGVHESDYTPHKMQPQEPDFSKEGRTAEHKTTGSRMPRKRKAPTVDLTGGSRQQLQRPSSSKGKSGAVGQDWCCYLLLSVDSKKTYVGVTFDIRRRVRQHNGEIAGGAKSARAGRPWRLVCTVQGFISRSEACQFEWRWKSTAAKIKTIKRQESEIIESPLITRRRATLAKVLEAKEDWNDLNVKWHGH